MSYPKSDACCTRRAWIELIVDTNGCELHVSVAPDTDCDGRFNAFCHDEQEMIWINGWLADNIDTI